MLIVNKISSALRPLGTHHFSTLFQLNEKTKRIQNECRKFAEMELAPVADAHDKLSCFPEKQIERLGQMGLMGACIEEKYGGAGHDLISVCLAIEELSRCCASTGIIVSIHNCLYAELVQSFGTEKQIEEFLIPFTKGQIGVFALSEHEAGSDAANLTSTAASDGNDFILNGCKAWVTSGYEAKAGVFFISNDASLGHKGITAFLIPFNTPGVLLGRKEEKLGIRASSTCDIILQDVRVPKSNVVGAVGAGFEIAMRQLQLGRIGVAAQAIGIGQAAFNLAVKYACERTVFGEKLANKQLVKSKIANMAVELESARLLCSMAKFAASRCATNNAHKCVQILGARGFVSGLAERYYRDSRITQIYGGPTDIQKLIIADLVLKEAELKSSELD